MGLRVLLLLCRLRHVRGACTDVLRTLPHLGAPLVLVAVHVVSFAFVGHLLLHDYLSGDVVVDGGRRRKRAACEFGPTRFDRGPAAACPRYPDETKGEACGRPQDGPALRQDYFSTMPEAVVQMFVALTSANFPDIAWPYMRHRSRTWFVFFAVYLSLGLVFVLNHVLGSAFSAFRRNHRASMRRLLGRRRASFERVFAFLDLEVTATGRKRVIRRGCSGRTRSRERLHLSRTPRAMIARQKLSQIEWKTISRRS